MHCSASPQRSLLPRACGKHVGSNMPARRGTMFSAQNNDEVPMETAQRSRCTTPAPAAATAIRPAEEGASLHAAALAYRPQNADDIGNKIGIAVTKRVASMDDLSLAYSPGVAVRASKLRATRRWLIFTRQRQLGGRHLNGTAVLGLGNIGAVARQAGDGRQVGAVQSALPALTRFYARDRPRPTRKTHRDHCQPPPHVWRHQPGRHQGAGVLKSDAPCCAPADSGVPTTSMAPRLWSPPG